VDAFMCYKQKCKVVSLNLAHPVYCVGADVKPCSINQSINIGEKKINKIPEFYTIFVG